MATELELARAKGVQMEGLCLYPVLNHFGWDDDRPCQNGLLEMDWADGRRGVFRPLAEELARAQRRIRPRAEALAPSHSAIDALELAGI